MELLRAALLLCCVASAAFTQQPEGTESTEDCVIELECSECIPEHMPLVTSHRAANGSVRVRAGERVRLACGAGRLAAYPLLAALDATCEAGRFRVADDLRLRHLLELGCQESVFEDVLHEVEDCSPPLQGRVYRTAGAGGAGGRHLAAVCYDADRGLAVRAVCGARRALRLPPHEERAGSPLSLFGNFNHMFDAATRAAAERLYADDARTNRRLRELFRHDDVAFGEQTLTAARLLSPHYFDDQDMRVADFVSNKVAAWRSVAAGNLRHVQRDVARLLARAPHLRVHAGTLGVAALRTDRTDRNATEIFLKGERFPVPKYVWTAVQEGGAGGRALVVFVLNEPLVAVSEVRAAALCASACARVAWLRETRRARRYETPLLGLTFCCNVRDAAVTVPTLPAALRATPPGDAGMLLDL